MRTGDISQAGAGRLPIHGDGADGAALVATCNDLTLASFLGLLTRPEASGHDIRAQFDSLNGAQLEGLAANINKLNRSERLGVLCLLVEKLSDGHDRHRLEKLRGVFLQEQNNSRENHSLYAEFSRIDQNHRANLNIRHEEIKGLAAEMFTSPPRHAALLFNGLDKKMWMPELAQELQKKHLQPLVMLLRKLGDNPDVSAGQFAGLAEAMLAAMSPAEKTTFAQELDRAGCLTSPSHTLYDPRFGMPERRSGPMVAFAAVVLAAIPGVPQAAG